MIQPRKSSNRHFSWTLWLGGLYCLSSFGMVAPVLAQTVPDTAPDAVAVPSAQDLLSAPAAESPVAAPAAPSSVPSAPATAPAPAAEAPPPKSVDLELSTPGGRAASAPASSSAPLISPNLSQKAESTFGQGSGLIDSTPYSLGATDNPNVVLSERSTGCERVIHPGQTVPNSVCSYGSENAAYAGREGAAPSLGGMSLSVIYGGGRSTPSGRDYYNLTIRPPAHLTSGGLNFLFPLSIPAAITSAFGWRLHPILGESLFHSGTDLGAPQGTPVLAAFSGKVAIADFMGGYGLAVVLQHDNGTEESLYGHLSEIFVKPGETVKQGEVIGRVGSTGLSTGPHLHFEFRKQTPNGWVVMDAGGALELALSQFVSALKLGLSYPPQLATIRATSFTEALAMAQVKSQAETKQTQEGAAELQSKSKTKPQASQDYSQD